MRLRFVGPDDDGTSLVLTDAEGEAGGQQYLLPIDDRLRAALRPTVAPRPESTALRTADRPTITPRQVQAMMRAGQDSEEISERIGWDVDRVRKFEPPILAEREFVATTAQAAHVRGRVVDGVFPTLGARVSARLAARGVDPADVRWNATRPEGGTWSVSVHFTAGNKERAAAWTYDAAGRTVEARDDEARWLSEDEQALPAGALGGFLPGEDQDDDLVSTIRQHNRARGRRSRRGDRPGAGEAAESAEAGAGEVIDLSDVTAEVDTTTGGSGPADLPGPDGDHRAAVLPLEDLPYDPDTMGPPPAASRPEEARTSRPRRGSRRAKDGRSDDPAPEFSFAAAPEAEESAEPRDVTLEDLFDDESDSVLDDGSTDDGSTDDGTGAADGTGADEPESVGADQFQEEAEQESADLEPADDEPEPEPEGRPTSGRKGRTSVPSWDDIMFGSRGKR